MFHTFLFIFHASFVAGIGLSFGVLVAIGAANAIETCYERLFGSKATKQESEQ